MEVVKEKENIVIITPREGSEVDRIRNAHKIINANLDTDMALLYDPLCEVLKIERNKAAETFIFGIICSFDTDENLAKQLINN